MDRWFEEEDEIFAHPPDPYHRIDVRQSSRRIHVRIDDEIVVETGRPRLLAVRYYVPPEDIPDGLLTERETRTRCAYKGEATYYSARVRGGVVEDVAWSYLDPMPEGWHIAGYVCFAGERVTITEAVE